jgi:hypothetical protein
MQIEFPGSTQRQMSMTSPNRCSGACTALIWLLVFFTGLLATNCTFVSERNYEHCPYTSSTEPGSIRGLTPAHDYAGEVLSYLLQVVVGRAGDPENRSAWRAAGLDMALDLQTISRNLSDPEYRKSNLFALDPDIVGLSEILYHYNPRLNQFKGRYVFDSLYPSAELIALRLLILQKLHRGETLSFSALLANEALLCADAPAPRAVELEAINLSLEEFWLLKDVFTSEPFFFQYYKHPFIVEALTRIGFYRREPATRDVTERASYAKYARKVPFIPWGRKLNITIVPSLTSEFHFGELYDKPWTLGFKPTADFVETTETLKTKILARTANLVRSDLRQQGAENTTDPAFWEMLWEQRYLPRLNFEVYDRRPFCIYPDIENRVLDELCSESDLAIVLLGKDVYRSFDFDTDRRAPESPERLYIDIEDIRYLYADEKIETIARFVADRLGSLASRACGPKTRPATATFADSVAPGAG